MAPIFEYECKECGNEEEKVLMVSEIDDEQKCSKCKNILTKLVSKFSFVLKGSGWHSTDYPS
jgi:putative FmdB family regulatory protein